MKITVLIFLLILWSFECSAKPFEQGSATDAAIEPTPYPDTQKRYVDLNNVSPEVSIILRENNMNLDQLRLMHEKLQNKTFYSSYSTTTTYTPPTVAKE